MAAPASDAASSPLTAGASAAAKPQNLGAGAASTPQPVMDSDYHQKMIDLRQQVLNDRSAVLNKLRGIKKLPRPNKDRAGLEAEIAAIAKQRGVKVLSLDSYLDSRPANLTLVNTIELVSAVVQLFGELTDTHELIDALETENGNLQTKIGQMEQAFRAMSVSMDELKATVEKLRWPGATEDDASAAGSDEETTQ